MSHNANETSPYVGTVGRSDPEARISERRRLVVDALVGRDTPVEFDDLVSDVVAREPFDDPRTDVAIDLHHVHLPKLVQADVVEYDTDRRLVESVDETNVAAASDDTDPLREAVASYFDAGTDDAASLDDLVQYASERLADDWTTDRLRLRLHHAVLPKLDAAGSVDYDPGTRTVSRLAGRL